MRDIEFTNYINRMQIALELIKVYGDKAFSMFDLCNILLLDEADKIILLGGEE